jgi:hypothetical protein
MILINLILIWIILIFLVLKPYLRHFEIKIERTFWGKKPYGISITKWDYPIGSYPNHGIGIFDFNWRNPKKISDDVNKKK